MLEFIIIHAKLLLSVYFKVVIFIFTIWLEKLKKTDVENLNANFKEEAFLKKNKIILWFQHPHIIVIIIIKLESISILNFTKLLISLNFLIIPAHFINY